MATPAQSPTLSLPRADALRAAADGDLHLVRSDNMLSDRARDAVIYGPGVVNPRTVNRQYDWLLENKLITPGPPPVMRYAPRSVKITQAGRDALTAQAAR